MPILLYLFKTHPVAGLIMLACLAMLMLWLLARWWPLLSRIDRIAYVRLQLRRQPDDPVVIDLTAQAGRPSRASQLASPTAPKTG